MGIDQGWMYSLLLKLPPEIAHAVALKGLKALHRLHLYQGSNPGPSVLQRTVMGLTFPNPVGLAAGLDKNGDYIDALASLGFGFLEIGTVTPQPQSGNPKPRLFRLPEAHALINRMGFNNKGVDYLVDRVSTARYQGILGINIGKNKTTPAERAVDDYIYCLRKVYPYASYITINISSPNTQGLRQLQFGEELDRLLQALKFEQRELEQHYQCYKPIVVKLSPDLSLDEIRDIAGKLLLNNIDGVIACNTTVGREGVEKNPLAQEAGGLSGQPLTTKNRKVMETLVTALQQKIPVIGVGGITTREDMEAAFNVGAELVQVYTALIYQGPGLIGKLLKA
jgi:dihydroorotate dehydrogenase